MTHLHRCSAHGPWPTEHPCTLAVPHLHYPAWVPRDPWPYTLHDSSVGLLMMVWWLQRRPRRAAA